MANIMMTDCCNLRCSYCFANEFVNNSKNDISNYNFLKAVDFIFGDKSEDSVGLIGGEPLLHSNFEYLLTQLINDKRAKRITVYTNGVYLDRFFDIICNRKIYLLINCNNPMDMGDSAYNKMVDNIDYLITKRLMRDQITLGVNIYSPTFDYSYILELLKRYEFNHVRVSITVPNSVANRNTDAHLYFESMKPVVLAFFYDLLDNEIIPNFDCNKIPNCLIKKDEIDSFKGYLSNDFLSKNISKSNISDPVVRCTPVIDIRQDLTAVRCFGLSESTKTNICDFRSIHDLKNYYYRTVDAYAYNTVYSKKCITCMSRKVMECMGGCLAFKIDEIKKMSEYSLTLQNQFGDLENERNTL